MRIYIPTKGRHNRQKTSAVLTKAGLHHYIVSEDEHMLYDLNEYAQFLPCPPSKLSAKRQWILDHAGKHMHIQVDDDFTFRWRDYVLDEKRFVRCGPSDVRAMFQSLEEQLKETAHAGVSDEFMCHTRPPGISRSGRYNGLLGYNPAFWRGLPKNRWPRFRIELNQDHDFSLQLHRLGFRPHILRDFTKSSTPYAKGGVSAYRKGEDEKKGHEALAALWPELVTVVPSKTSISGYRIRVNWQKAAKMADRPFR